MCVSDRRSRPRRRTHPGITFAVLRPDVWCHSGRPPSMHAQSVHDSLPPLCPLSRRLVNKPTYQSLPGVTPSDAPLAQGGRAAHRHRALLPHPRPSWQSHRRLGGPAARDLHHLKASQLWRRDVRIQMTSTSILTRMSSPASASTAFAAPPVPRHVVHSTRIVASCCDSAVTVL